MATSLVLAVALAAIAALASAAGRADEGYENLFLSFANEVPRVCVPCPSCPRFLQGSFVLPSVAQFELGAQVFTGMLDGFGKLHRFEVNNGNACFGPSSTSMPP